MTNFLFRFSLKIKIFIFVLVSLVFLSSIGLVGYLALNKSIESERILTEIEYPKIMLVQKLKSDNHAIARFLWTTHGLFAYAAERKNQIEESKNIFKNFENDIEELQKMSFGKENEKLIKDISTRWKDLKINIPKVIEIFEKGTEVADKEATMILSIDIVPVTNEIYDILNEFDKNIQKQIHYVVNKNKENSNKLISLIATSILTGVILLTILGIFIANQLSKHLLGVSQSIAENSRELSNAAQEVSNGASSLSNDSRRQAEAMAQTSASVHELNSMIALNSDNANRSVNISEKSKEEVLESQRILKNVINAINELDHGNADIADQVVKNNLKLEEIVKIILEINNKTAIINDIVFQIKLLSFNASVEAARAGEHGKGFSVVAEEIGNLAQGTAGAAKEITDLLKTSVEHVKKIAKETTEQIEHLVKNNKNNVDGCVKLSYDCDNFLKEVVSGSEEVNRMVQQISTSSNEQAKGVYEISQAMNQLADISRSSQKLSEGNQETVKVLYKQIENLKSEVFNLNRLVLGSHINSNEVKDLDINA